MATKERYESRLGALYRRNEKFLFISTVIFLGSLCAGYFLSDMLDFFLKNMLDQFKRSVARGEITLNVFSLFANNIKILLFIYGGGALLGLFTLIFLFINGAFIGYFATTMPLGDFIFLTLPHGIFEIPSIIIGGAAGFRLASFVYKYIDSLINETWYGSTFGKVVHVFEENIDEFKESLILLGIAIVLMFIAAIVEANFTLGIYQYLKSTL